MYIFNGAYSIFYLMHHNINEYNYIWGSNLGEFRLKGFGLARVYCTDNWIPTSEVLK